MRVNKTGRQNKPMSDEVKIARRQKFEQTMLERHGPDWKEQRVQKAKQTSIKKYGVEHSIQLAEYRDKKSLNLVRLKQQQENERLHTNYLEEQSKKEAKKKLIVPRIKKPKLSEEERQKRKEQNQKIRMDRFKATNARKKIERLTAKGEGYKLSNDYKNSSRLDKIKITNQEKYGVDCIFQSDHTKQANKDALITKYGVGNAQQSPELKEKKRQTNLLRYGYGSTLESPEVQQKLKDIRNSKELLGFQDPDVLNKFENTLEARYGEGVIWSPYKNHTNEMLKIIQDGEYLKQLYSECSDIELLIKQIGCTENWLKVQLIKNSILSRGAIKGTSVYEEEIFNWLMSQGINCCRNNRKVISPYEIDLYNEDLKIGIEFNDYWHSIDVKDGKNYHQKRSLLAIDRGIKLLHIFEYDWNNPLKKDILKSIMLNMFHKTPTRIYARQCQLKQIDWKEATKFVEENHLQGDGNLCRQINYGLYYQGDLVFLLALGKWRRGKIADWEIFRVVSKKYSTVVGGFSKCLKHFLNNHQGTLATYSSLALGGGEVYKNNNFKLIKVTKPSSIKTDGKNIYTMFSKNYKQKDLLEIYGCGNYLWSYIV